jgi:acyl-CoA synthetase (AMP-forming)/AMP-acid ligase II
VTASEGLNSNLIQRVNLGDALRRSAALYRDKIALTDAHGVLSFRELHEETNRIGRGLLDERIGRGDFVALLFRNCIDFFTVYYACARIGAVALPLNPTLSHGEMLQLIEESKPTAFVAQGDFQQVSEALAEEAESIKLLVIARTASNSSVTPSTAVRPRVLSLEKLRRDDATDVEVFVDDRDTVQCIYTSGTTARPKGVLTSHVASVLTAVSVAHHMHLTDTDTGLVVLPIHHVGGLNDATIPHLTVGAGVVLVDGWNAENVARLLERHRVTDVVLTGPMWIDLININTARTYDWSALRTCLFGIATLPPERAQLLRSMCPNAVLLMASGQTEFCGYEEGQRVEHQQTKPLAWGDPTLMTDVGIMDENGTLLSPGEVGEIVYRGPQAMTAYFGDPGLTAEAFKFGWFHSGDLGYLDEEHTVFFVDRKKDMIKTGGENVASVEVADVLLGHPAVSNCAIVGLPHQRWTEAVTAFVITSSETSEEDLIAHCKQRLAGYKVPKRVLTVDELPTTASGKVQKVRLRAMYRDLYT